MAVAGPDVMIKPRAGGMIFMTAWIGFLCLLMVLGAADEHDARGLFLVFVWLPWLVPVALIARSQLAAAGDALTYRGPFRTRAWRRAEIGYFAIIPSRWSPLASRLAMRTSRGEWVTFAIARTSWPRGTRQLERWLGALEDWRSSSGQQQQPD